jgi:Tol biopolymer transport system component
MRHPWRLGTGLLVVLGFSVITSIVLGVSFKGSACLRIDGVILSPSDPNYRHYQTVWLDADRKLFVPVKQGRPLKVKIGESPDGDHVAYFTRTNVTERSIFVETISTGVINKLDGIRTAYFPLWSPDGRWLAYLVEVAYDPHNPDRRPHVVLAKADGTSGHIFLQEGTNTNLLGWSSDSAYVALQLTNGHIGLISVAKMSQHSLPIGDTSYRPLLWSPQGHRMAYVQNNQLYLVDPDTSLSAQFTLPLPLQFSALIWSSDGRYILAAIESADQRGKYRLDIYGTDGSIALNIGEMAYALGLPVWSQDGQWVLFTELNKHALMAYNRNDGRYEILLSDVIGPILDSPDGRNAVITQQKGNKTSIYGIGLNDRLVAPLVDNLEPIYMLRWALDGQAVSVITEQGGSYEVGFVDVAYRKYHRLLSELSKAPVLLQGKDQSKQIAFWWQTADGSTGLDGYDSNGTLAFRLKTYLARPDLPVNDSRVFWSPDRRFAAVQVPASGMQYSLQIASSDGQMVYVLQQQNWENGRLFTWSPDSSTFAYQDLGPSGNTIDIVNVDGTKNSQFAGLTEYENLAWSDCEP